MSSYFDGVKVGDRVWSYDKQKWGTVTGTHCDSSFPIVVNFSDVIDEVLPENMAELFPFSYTGRGPYQTGQTLFWDEVKITPPPRPKRKVEKTIHINLHRRQNVLSHLGHLLSLIHI